MSNSRIPKEKRIRYRLADFFQRNGISQRRICKALKCRDKGHLSDTFTGKRTMPSEYDEKLKNMVLLIYKSKRAYLTKDELLYVQGRGIEPQFGGPKPIVLPFDP